MSRLIIFLILFSPRVAFCNDDSQEFGARRYPVLPMVSVAHEADLCAYFRDATRRQFLSKAHVVAMSPKSAEQLTWMQWPTHEPLGKSGGSVSKLEVSLDNGASNQILLYWIQPHSWRGDWHFVYVVKDAATLDKWVMQAGGLGQLLSREGDLAKPQMAPDMRRIFPTGSSWEPPMLFFWAQQVYLVGQSLSWGLDSGAPINVYRVAVDGALDLQCAIELPNLPAHIDEAMARAGLSPLLEAMKRIGGNGNGNCGTLNAEARNFRGAMNQAHLSVVRPWATSRLARSYDSSGREYESEGRMWEFLNDWSLSSAWNRLAYLEARQHIEPTEKSYAEFLRSEFGIEARAASKRAQDVVKNIVASWVEVPSGYIPKQDRYSVEPHPLALAINQRDSLALIALTSDKERMSAPVLQYPAPNPPTSVASDQLHNAVIWPKALRELLSAGADVNGRNVFGKTALMTAAHLNRPDAIDLLIEKGADVNAVTQESFSGCGYSVEVGHRTALMYAAENAGLQTIQRLLRAGADVKARDTKGGDIDSYLKKNPRLVGLRVSSIAELLRLEIEDTPSFACVGKLSASEKEICDDSILKMLDREIAHAYARLLPAVGKGLRLEQRRWLRERDGRCQNADRERRVGCLQDEMNARARGLYHRLEAVSH